MKERFKFSLSGIWLLIGIFSMILPVFLPSSSNPQNFVQNVIGTTTVTMFILSFPSSLFGLPLLYFAALILGVDTNSMEGMYLNLFLLFVLGLVQWFWIFPQVLRNEQRFQTLNLLSGKSRIQVLEPEPANSFQTRDFQEYTPLEKVIFEKDKE